MEASVGFSLNFDEHDTGTIVMSPSTPPSRSAGVHAFVTRFRRPPDAVSAIRHCRSENCWRWRNRIAIRARWFDRALLVYRSHVAAGAAAFEQRHPDRGGCSSTAPARPASAPISPSAAPHRCNRAGAAGRCGQSDRSDGLAVSPGFIDTRPIPTSRCRSTPSREQGAPRRHHEIIGHCGFRSRPPPGKVELLRDYLSPSAPWLPFKETTFRNISRLSGNRSQCRHAGRPQHAAPDGHGHGRRPPTANELAAMIAL